MKITTEFLAALWFTVLPAQVVRPAYQPACTDARVFVKPIEADAAGSLRYVQDAGHRRFADAVMVGNAAPSKEPPLVDAKLAAVEILHEGERHAHIAVRATCPVNARCRVPGLVAREVAFEVESIRWTPGLGWPEYHDTSPRDDRSVAMLYPDALVHQFVLAIGANGFTACPAAAVARATTAGEVSFLVNDDKYDDNEGTFSVLIESLVTDGVSPRD